MHPWRDDHTYQRTLHSLGKPQVRVVEGDGDEDQPLPQMQGPRRGPDHEHLGRAVGDRQDHLAEMEADRSRGGAVEIRMVDQVEAPKERDPVGPDVPDIEGVVHQEDCHSVLHRARQAKLRHNPPAAALHEFGERLHHRLLKDLQGRGAERGNRQVAQVATELAFCLAAQRALVLKVERRRAGTDHEGSTQPARKARVSVLRHSSTPSSRLGRP